MDKVTDKVMERTTDARQGVVGSCPYCNGTSYNRDFGAMDGDVVECDAYCECGEEFKEFFYLAYQSWIPTEPQVKEMSNAR